VRYLLDTNACLALINGNPSAVRERFEKALSGAAEVFVSTVVAYELWYGVAKSGRPEKNAKHVETFFVGPVALLPFDDRDAQAAGVVRAALETPGKPIGAYDALIAGQALRHKLTLVTSNEREFGRVKGLLWEDWGKE
jgi:tRNA(fMet)-specific endonuclease VapC